MTLSLDPQFSAVFVCSYLVKFNKKMAPETDLFSRGEFLPLEENDVSSVIEAHNSLDWDKNQDRDNGEPARPTTN